MKESARAFLLPNGARDGNFFVTVLGRESSSLGPISQFSVDGNYVPLIIRIFRVQQILKERVELKKWEQGSSNSLAATVTKMQFCKGVELELTCHREIG